MIMVWILTTPILDLTLVEAEEELTLVKYSKFSLGVVEMVVALVENIHFSQVEEIHFLLEALAKAHHLKEEEESNKEKILLVVVLNFFLINKR